MTPPPPTWAELCRHLRPYFGSDEPAARGTLDDWTGWGFVVLVGSEPPGAAAAGPPLEQRSRAMQTSGVTASLTCTEHGQALAWGTGGRPEVSAAFAARARLHDARAGQASLAERARSRGEARRERHEREGTPLVVRLLDRLLDR